MSNPFFDRPIINSPYEYFGAPPGEAAGTPCVVTTAIDTPLGPMVAGATDEGLCLLEFTDRRMLEAQLTRLRKLLRLPLVPGEPPRVTAS